MRPSAWRITIARQSRPAGASGLAGGPGGFERVARGLPRAPSPLYRRPGGHLLSPPAALRATAAVVANRQGQPGLWRFGISGDLPILLVCISEGDGMPL